MKKATMRVKSDGGVVIRNAHTWARNFRGAAKRTKDGRLVNSEGNRNFCVYLPDPHKAEQLLSEGWNIKKRVNPNDDQDISYMLQVSVSFKGYPPKISIINADNSQTYLDESNVALLDNADISKADLSIRPYHWTVGDKTGVKAYAKELRITLEEDDFADDPEPLDLQNDELPF